MSRGTLKKVFPIYQLIDLIFEMDNISSSEKLLCIALLRFHNRKSGRCFPGLTRLSESTGMSRKTLIENTKKLEKKKVIKVKKGNRTKPNEYNLLFIGWLDIEPQSEPLIEPLSEPPIEPQPEPLTTPKQRKGKGKERDNIPPKSPKKKNPIPTKTDLKELIIENNLIENKEKIFEFFEYRMSMPAKDKYKTILALKMLFKDLCGCRDKGLIISECIDEAMGRGWKTPKPDYFKNKPTNGNQNNPLQGTNAEKWLKSKGVL